MSQEKDYAVFTDGGGDHGQGAVSACMVVHNASGKKIRFAAYLGKATNNEAEITAGLVALSFVKFHAEKHGLSAPSVKWVGDSEYVLKSANNYIKNWLKNGWKTADKEPVKNKGMWQAYLAISEKMELKMEHTYGHSGHPENEACDKACWWVREHLEELLRESDFFVAVSIPAEARPAKWYFIDARELIEPLRRDSPLEKEMFAFFTAYRKRAGSR